VQQGARVVVDLRVLDVCAAQLAGESLNQRVGDPTLSKSFEHQVARDAEEPQCGLISGGIELSFCHAIRKVAEKRSAASSASLHRFTR
jgi:hypothetical protein